MAVKIIKKYRRNNEYYLENLNEFNNYINRN